MEMGDLRKMFHLNSTDIYGPTPLAVQPLTPSHALLTPGHSPTPRYPATPRHHFSLSHSHSRLKMNAPSRREDETQGQKVLSFVALVGQYNEEGITMVRTGKEVVVREKGRAWVEWQGEERRVGWMEEEYEDYREVLGWEEGEWGCCQEEWEVDLTGVREGERHQLKMLPTHTTRSPITAHQFTAKRHHILKTSP